MPGIPKASGMDIMARFLFTWDESEIGDRSGHQGPGGRWTTFIQVTTQAATAAEAMAAASKNQRSASQPGLGVPFAPLGRVVQGRTSLAKPRRASSERPYRATATSATSTHSRGPGNNPQSHPMMAGTVKESKLPGSKGTPGALKADRAFVTR